MDGKDPCPKTNEVEETILAGLISSIRTIFQTYMRAIIYHTTAQLFINTITMRNQCPMMSGQVEITLK